MSVSSSSEPCRDCLDVHGDNRQQWLTDYPEGAEYRADFLSHLCDGCYDDRIDHLRAQAEA